MKTQLLFLVLTVITAQAFSQIKFEKGYYIDNSGIRIEAFIKNGDWIHNPAQFEYKSREDGSSQQGTLATVREFAFYDGLRYVRSTVKMDRSGDEIRNLGADRNPVFVQEEIFLKVLVEGKAILYQYTGNGIERFFYSRGNSEVEPLIFKRYKKSETRIGKNNTFRQQLLNDLHCPDFEIGNYEDVSYRKKDLMIFFANYSLCHNIEPQVFEENGDRDLFNLTLRPRLSRSDLRVVNPAINFPALRSINFDEEFTLGLGVEAEFILPFHKNKWSVFVEPTYQYFKTVRQIDENTSGGIYRAEIDYRSVEIPLGLRHYFFLNDRSAVFVNASYVIDLSRKSSIDFVDIDDAIVGSLEIQTGNNFSAGLGYKLENKYSLELRWQGRRDVLHSYVSWHSSYNTLSFILGYSLF